MERSKLLRWYRKNFRPLPWRETNDPYKIWVAEIMLQQTTAKAVTPYFNRFLNRFPTVDVLADSSEGAVLKAWSGLGYYSRARNLHKSAQLFSQNGFPNTWEELIRLPGLGPYTARAVATFSFGERVGVLDGNVIRFLSRYHNQKVEWWKTAGRSRLQNFADSWADHKSPGDINQALIEMGATVCLKQNPACLICPLVDSCKGRKSSTIFELPLAKPKKNRETWVWKPVVLTRGKKIGLVTNNYAPFLKGQLIWPGMAYKQSHVPSKFDFKHAVTHHDIYVKLSKPRADLNSNLGDIKWFQRDELKEVSPTSLVSKALDWHSP